MANQGRPALGRRIERLYRSGLRLPRRLAHAARVALDILYWTLTFQLRAGLRRRRDARLVRRSRMFDVHHYLAQCGGEERARRDPVLHYLTTGAARGLDPCPLFDTSAYVEQHPDAAGENPLAHYLRSRGTRRDDGSGADGLDRRSVREAEELLARAPFRSPAEEGRHVLVVEPVAAGASAAERLATLLEAARAVGPVVLVRAATAPDDREAPHADATIVRGFQAALAHLEREGHRCRAVLVLGGVDAARWLAPARAYAPWATFVHDAAGAAELGTEERASAVCADVVLAATQDERDRLRRSAPEARVEVVPDLAPARLVALLGGAPGVVAAPPRAGSAA